jgi:hypothetical protein
MVIIIISVNVDATVLFTFRNQDVRVEIADEQLIRRLPEFSKAKRAEGSICEGLLRLITRTIKKMTQAENGNIFDHEISVLSEKIVVLRLTRDTKYFEKYPTTDFYSSIFEIVFSFDLSH